MSYRARLIVRALALAAALATALAVGVMWLATDPNADTAEHVVRDAGVPATVTPGPGGTR